MPVMLLFFLGLGILVFFMSIAIHLLRIEKSLRDTFIMVELRVKRFLEDGRD